VIERLEAELRENSSLSEILRRFDDIGLPDAWIVAGCIAQTVWNLACGRAAESSIKDIDIVYFDAAELSAATEADHERRLADYFSDLPVKLDVKRGPGPFVVRRDLRLPDCAVSLYCGRHCQLSHHCDGRWRALGGP